MKTVISNEACWLNIRAAITDKYLTDECNLIGFEFREKSKYERRSKWDVSKRLTMYYINKNDKLAKVVTSFQNNQHHKIEIPLNMRWLMPAYKA